MTDWRKWALAILVGAIVVAGIVAGANKSSSSSSGHKGCKCGDSYISCSKVCHK